MTTKTKIIYDDLKARYKKSVLSKAEMANELGVSISSIDKYMAHSLGVPPYKKLGSAKNAKVVFNIIDVAEFLADTVKVVA